MLSIRSATVALATLAACGLAAAQTKTWNFGDITAPGYCTGGTGIGNIATCNDQAAGNGAPFTLNVSGFSVANTAGSTFAKAEVTYQGTGAGFGLTYAGEPTGSPQHAIDNEVNTDALLLSFTSAQVLQQVTIGWRNLDSDFQVLRWTGAGPAVVEGKTTANLLAANGWTLVSTIDGQSGTAASDTDVTYSNVNTGNLSSSYWLISAFNSAFGAGGSSGFDAFKVLSVAAQSSVGGNQVPEPGSLALAGMALAGMVGGLRRRAQRTA